MSDFKKVIDLKVSQWMGDNKMRKFLRPATLFIPSHFDDYLNELTDEDAKNIDTENLKNLGFKI